MNFDYIEESRKLKHKLIIFIGIMIAFTVLGMVAFEEGFGESLTLGVAAALLFYIPGRLKGIMNIGWIGAIILGIIFNLVFLFIVEKLGTFGEIVYLLVPVVDIGYSIYKVVMAKKNG